MATNCELPGAASNPCAAAKPDAAALAGLSDCLRPIIANAYKGGQHWSVDKWSKWHEFSKHGYVSATHGERYVMNFGNKIANTTYGQYEQVTKMPVGSTLAKPSFTIGKDGKANIGPLFIMEKMVKGWNSATEDWRYAMIMPGGKTFGLTKGANATGMGFCHDCHTSTGHDAMFFLPEDVRK